MWIKTEGITTHFDRRDAEYLNENCKGISTRKFVPMKWPARSPDLHMPDFFLCNYIKWMIVTQVQNTTPMMKCIDDKTQHIK